MDKIGDIIGRNKYNYLKSLNKTLTDVEKEQILAFEEANRPPIFTIPEKKVMQLTPGIPVNKATIWKAFKIVWKLHTKKDFVENEHTIKNIAPVINYFAKHETFYQCENLVKVVEGVRLEPNFDKGLLVIGAYGNGKSTTMEVLAKAFDWMYNEALENHWDTLRQWQELRYKCYKSHDVVTEFESISNPQAKENFYKKYKSSVIYIDDLKKEQVALNYGKTEVIRVIQEKRYDANKKMYGTCNYKEKSMDLLEGLMEFGDRYGGHIYDRLFLMYNIIEFKGKSFRK